MSIVALVTRLTSAIKAGWLPLTDADGELFGLDPAGTASPIAAVSCVNVNLTLGTAPPRGAARGGPRVLDLT